MRVLSGREKEKNIYVWGRWGRGGGGKEKRRKKEELKGGRGEGGKKQTNF